MGVAIRIADATFTKYIGIAEIEEKPCQHVYDDGVVTLAPTCSEGGVKTYTCTLCGHTYTEVIPATGEHTYVDGYCSVCGDMDIPTTYPVTDTLKGLYYLGGTQAESIVDRSDNGNTATVKGTITCADGYATFADNGVTNRLDTPVLPSTENKTTIVALFRVPTGIRSIASTFETGKGGFVLTNDRTYLRAIIDGTANTGANVRFTNAGGVAIAVGVENFALCAMSIDNNSCRVVKDANGSLVELLNTTENPCNWVNTISIGGNRTNMSFNDTADIALVSIHEGDMSDAQLRHIFAYVRNKYAVDKGLTIE